MALANFFDRTATAAAQVLKGFDLDAFGALLQSQSIAVAFDNEASGAREARTSLELLVNLLARLYPGLIIAGIGRDAAKYADSLEVTAKAINPAIEVRRNLDDAVTIVAVGSPRLPSVKAFYIGSDGWVARLSTRGPLASGQSSNPFGAGAAACFAAANVFRQVFRRQLPEAVLDKKISVSLLSYGQTPREIQNPALSSVNLGSTALVGVGAVGNAFVWALSRVGEVTGSLALIDHETLDLSNLQRYVLAKQEKVAQKKPEIAASLFKTSGVQALPFNGTWADYLRSKEFRVERAAVALDSVEDRIAVQAALPRYVINSWTQTLDIGVSRHEFLGENACLACLYLPNRKLPDEDVVIAQAFGLPAAQFEIRRLLFYNAPVERGLLARVATSLTIPLDALLPFEGKPIRSFYVEAFCGGAVFRLSEGKRATPTLVPLAFQSAMAGIMLAAEVVAHCAGLKPGPPPVTTTMNLLTALPPYLSFGRKKDPSGRCICQDKDYIAAYQKKWGNISP